MSSKSISVALSASGIYRFLVVAAAIFLGLQAPVAFAQGSAVGDQLLKQLGQLLQGAVQPKPVPQQDPASQPQAPPAQPVPPILKRKAEQASARVPPSPPLAQGRAIDDQWFGNWKSGSSYSFDISANRFRYIDVVGDESVYQKRLTTCTWSPAKDALYNPNTSGKCQFSDSQRMKSKVELVRSFQEAFRRYPEAYEKSAQTKMVRNLELMNAGPHKVVILNNNNDVTELIFDGQHLFQIEDRDRNSVSVYTRSAK